MNYPGFRQTDANSQYIIEVVFPAELNKLLFARFYGRGPVCGGKEGEPDQIWEDLSYNYHTMPLVAPRQVHGTAIIPACKEHRLPLRESADGVFISPASDCLASLRFADCTPVVIAGCEPEPWMVLLHSGFVGTMKNIAEAGLAYARGRYGAVCGDKVWAWLGPGICGKCYCRSIGGDEVTKAAMKLFAPENMNVLGDRCFFDIHGQIKKQLHDSGLSRGHIYDYGCCTKCGGEPLYSYRGGDLKDRIFLLAGNTIK